jgi:hypothetical protein
VHGSRSCAGQEQSEEGRRERAGQH